MEDEKIVSLYWDRDEGAIRETEEKYDRYLTKIAYYILSNHEDSRESVNVNTGERIEIQGHTKISFTPDATMKELINKPFSHFETVILNEGVELEDTPVETSEEIVQEEIKILRIHIKIRPIFYE